MPTSTRPCGRRRSWGRRRGGRRRGRGSGRPQCCKLLIHCPARINVAAALSGPILVLKCGDRGIEFIAADPCDDARIEAALRSPARPRNAVQEIDDDLLIVGPVLAMAATGSRVPADACASGHALLPPLATACRRHVFDHSCRQLKMRFTTKFRALASPTDCCSGAIGATETPSQTESWRAENRALHLGKKGSQCYTIGRRRIEPSRSAHESRSRQR